MREQLVLCNTSPLLYLNLIGYLSILPALYQQITIPTAVRNELLVGQKQGVQIPDIDNLPWLKIVSVSDRNLIPNINDLGAGEAELIGLGRQYPQSRLILDDLLGRRLALSHNLIVTGTVGVVIKAKQENLIPTVKPIVNALQEQGLWLSHDLVNLILRRAGE